MRRAVLLATLVLVAGCSSFLGPLGSTADPDSDRLGWENGYWHDESIDVTPDDGYNASEREAIVSRAMARVERIRQLEFTETVPVEVISRRQYLRNRSAGDVNSTYNRWNNQVWEALFLVGESDDVARSFNATLGASVQGYYAPGSDEIVIVSDSPTPTIDRSTLSHELVHALQDQHFTLGGSPDTQDRQLATDGVIEGDANYVQRRYRQRCDGGWDCLPRPERGDSGGDSPEGYDRGVFLTVFQPYATGPEFVRSIHDADGWAGVNDLYDAFPDSTEQTIHPELYPDERPVNVSVPDRSNGQWSRFDHDPVADTVGEASIYAMFAVNNAITVETMFGYRSDPSAGWGGDSLVPYRNDGAYGYVWTTVWDTETDAQQFLEAYRSVLAEHDATNPRSGVYVVPESDAFGDAFRVVRDGVTVRIVNAPSVSALDGVHARSDR